MSNTKRSGRRGHLRHGSAIALLLASAVPVMAAAPSRAQASEPCDRQEAGRAANPCAPARKKRATNPCAPAQAGCEDKAAAPANPCAPARKKRPANPCAPSQP